EAPKKEEPRPQPVKAEAPKKEEPRPQPVKAEAPKKEELQRSYYEEEAEEEPLGLAYVVLAITGLLAVVFLGYLLTIALPQQKLDTFGIALIVFIVLGVIVDIGLFNAAKQKNKTE
ncbi:MAG: hypothetical protein RDV48_22370, partial [Candidatus Eremiobacteraeota bacterium]|nr:hypothetical protein [Candidatus Eremiobacteraeota bacterium]